MPFERPTLPAHYPAEAHQALNVLMELYDKFPGPEPLKIHASLPENPETAEAPTLNPAVERCRQAYTEAVLEARKKGEGRYDAEKIAKQAYREAMPPLSGAKNIRDFVACVAHAMLIDVINVKDGSRILYAAQVAHNAQLRRNKKKHNPNQSNNIPAQNS